MKIRSLSGVNLYLKKVLLRVDVDVPLARTRSGDSTHGDFNFTVKDDFRLQRMLPTFNHLLDQKDKIIVIGHLNRPAGRVKEEDRMTPVVDWFGHQYPGQIKYVPLVVGVEARQTVMNLKEGEILFLENLRFDSGEEANRESFARELSSYGEVFVNECFATSHRGHASIVGIPRFLPAFAGLNLQSEIENLSQVLSHARRPLVVIIGGEKIETKIPVIDKFLTIADKILVTGKVGVEMDKLAHYHSQKLIYSTGEVDILPDELERFVALIAIAGTIVWNGPAGDVSRGYVEGTKKLAEAILSTNVRTIVGGGHTHEILRQFGLRDKFSFVSTGGGAMLDFLAGKALPGLVPLLIA